MKAEGIELDARPNQKRPGAPRNNQNARKASLDGILAFAPSPSVSRRHLARIAFTAKAIRQLELLDRSVPWNRDLIEYFKRPKSKGSGWRLTLLSHLGQIKGRVVLIEAAREIQRRKLSGSQARQFCMTVRRSSGEQIFRRGITNTKEK